MNPAAIIQQAAADGVKLTLSSGGTVKATGDQTAVNRWLPIIRERKEEIAAALALALSELVPNVPAVPSEKNMIEQEAELRRLVHEVAQYHDFSAEDEREALEKALADFDDALICFRALRRSDMNNDETTEAALRLLELATVDGMFSGLRLFEKGRAAEGVAVGAGFHVELLALSDDPAMVEVLVGLFRAYLLQIRAGGEPMRKLLEDAQMQQMVARLWRAVERAQADDEPPGEVIQ